MDSNEIRDLYSQGTNDAWEAVKTLYWDLTIDEVENLFGVDDDEDDSIYQVLTKFTATEAIEKIRAYKEEKKKINIGDEVYYGNDSSFVVTNISHLESENMVWVIGFDENGDYSSGWSRSMTKTGRHFPQIAEVLKCMQEKKHEN